MFLVSLHPHALCPSSINISPLLFRCRAQPARAQHRPLQTWTLQGHARCQDSLHPRKVRLGSRRQAEPITLRIFIVTVSFQWPFNKYILFHLPGLFPLITSNDLIPNLFFTLFLESLIASELFFFVMFRIQSDNRTWRNCTAEKCIRERDETQSQVSYAGVNVAFDTHQSRIL